MTESGILSLELGWQLDMLGWIQNRPDMSRF